MKFIDTVTLADGSLRRTKDGYLAASALVARGANVQRYTGAELGKPDRDFVDVFRPDSEVFQPDVMQSFAHRPLTNNHPAEMVTADNWREYAVGYSGDQVARDGDYIRVPLLLTDAATIADMEHGKRELSMGYTSDIEWTDGITPSGEHYDAIQRNIRNNHIALVDRARAGHKARIGDTGTPSNPAGTPKEGRIMADTQTAVLDGLSIETTAQGAQAITKLQKQLNDAGAEREELVTSYDEVLADKDAELAKRDAKIAELEKAQVKDADLDKLVTERAELIGKAKTIKDGDYVGSPADIRKAAVVAALGDEAVKDKSDAYIEARFDILADEAKSTDPVRKAIADGNRTKTTDADPYDAWLHGKEVA